MSELFLVRHAQASFGEDNYDRLSLMGHQQARWLGEYFQTRGLQFDRVVCGDMVRHRETLAGVASATGADGNDFITDPLWNEFDFEALVDAYLEQRPGERPATDAPRNHLFLVLRKALMSWSANDLRGNLPESWESFESRVRDALSATVNDAGQGKKILVISSGGAISMAIRQVLMAPASTMVQLNLQTRNSGFSHLFFNESSIQLAGFNHVPHLDRHDRTDAITYY